MKKTILLFAVVLLSLQIGFCQKDSLEILSPYSLTEIEYSKNRKNESSESICGIGIDAQYVGGFSAFQKYVNKNIKYPKQARKKKIQGRANVEFIIEKDGTISDVKSAGKVLGYGLDEEAVRLVKENPTKWIPAQQNGKVVRLRKTLPIPFKL
jgi:TonB family protein